MGEILRRLEQEVWQRRCEQTPIVEFHFKDEPKDMGNGFFEFSLLARAGGGGWGS